TTKQNGFDMIDDLVAAVKSGNRDTLGDVMLPRIDNFIDNLLSVMSSNGALQNRYNTNVERLTKDNVVMTDSYDKLVKVDPADVATQMMMASYMYQANLSVISQLIQPSLLDFLH
ncbi:MAG: flagellar hook-associated protein 3, partial [Synergistaceae bacterium]|nr:flagellar hook-associated protein 3 [Synergistaceae bacterium]